MKSEEMVAEGLEVGMVVFGVLHELDCIDMK